MFRADSAALVVHRVDRSVHTVRASWNLHPDADRLYEQHYGSIDVWARLARSKPTGYVCQSQHLCPLSELGTTEIYNDFLSKYGVVHGLFGQVENDPSHTSGVSLYRDLSSNEFSASDLEILNFLIPHLQRAFSLHVQISELKARSEAIETALNMLATGVVFLGTGGEIVLLNKRAEELLNCKDGLLLAQGKLRAGGCSESVGLQAMIGIALQTGNGRGFGAGGTILISRETGRPLSLTVAPLRGFNATLSQRSAAVVFISDPDRDLEFPADLLQRCYGLTPAEARLAMALLEGHSLKEVADTLCVTHNTAKSQLKCIFLKTQVKRQGELIRLLLTAEGVVSPRVEAS
jgi:DNA-binding CsgD family transcriptional regulator